MVGAAPRREAGEGEMMSDAILDARDRVIRSLYAEIARLNAQIARLTNPKVKPRIIECSGGRRKRVR